MKVVLKDNVAVPKDIVKLMEDNCFSWRTPFPEYQRAVWANEHNELVTIEEELEQWELEDTEENRERVRQHWQTDYVEWMEVYGDRSVSFGQGDYIIHTKWQDLELERIDILGYEPQCQYRLKLRGEFIWEDSKKTVMTMDGPKTMTDAEAEVLGRIE
jgi:hypothetical protein